MDLNKDMQIDKIEPSVLDLDSQELEEMDAPGWEGTVSAIVSATAVTIGVAIT